MYDFEAELRVVISTRARNEAVPETLRVRIAEKLTLFVRGEITDAAAAADADPRIGQPPTSDA